jgi:hypothetical protein
MDAMRIKKSHDQDIREVKLFGEKVFKTLPSNFTREICDACNPPITASGIARCLGFYPKGKAIRKTWSEKRGLPVDWALNLLEAAYSANRLDTRQYTRIKETVNRKEVNIVLSGQQINYYKEVLDRGVKLGA